MIAVINSLIVLNILIVVAAVISACAFVFVSRVSCKSLLRFNYQLLVGVGACWLATALVSPAAVNVPIKHLPQMAAKAIVPAVVQPQPIQVSSESAEPIKLAVAVTLLFLVVALVAYMFREVVRLMRALMRSHLYKRVGRVEVRLSQDVTSPFSSWLPYRHCIVLPYELALKPEQMRMCVAHEIQHHRQHDTQWVYVLIALRVLCFFNPAVYLWNRLINEVQEFSCDEVLLGRKNFARDAYIGCLVEVAENSLKRKQSFVCATSLGFVKGQNLKRRIEMMLNKKSKARAWAPWGAAVSIVLISIAAFAGKTTFEERKATFDMELPINREAKQELIKELNKILSDPLHRKEMRESLARLEKLKPQLSEICKDDCDPFYAVGLTESGYQNLPPQHGDPSLSTGMWQIILSTARRLDLVVDENVDERRDAIKAANAAWKYLQMNRERFNSIDLSVLAYNAGENAVEEAVTVTGSENPWQVRRVLSSQTQQYYLQWLSGLMVIKNPHMVEENTKVRFNKNFSPERYPAYNRQ